MSKQDTGGHAFPFTATGFPGMTLRDYFAAKAMQGIYACPVQIYEPDGSDAPDPLTDADIARLAYATADAMLEARK